MKALRYLFVLSTILFVAYQVETDSLLPGDTDSIQLRGNRILSYVEFGPADGIPVLYFHGFPGSHQEIHLFKGAELAEKYNLRLIAVDRPGYGNSGSFPGRTLTDWPDDIQQLAGYIVDLNKKRRKMEEENGKVPYFKFKYFVKSILLSCLISKGVLSSFFKY